MLNPLNMIVAWSAAGLAVLLILVSGLRSFWRAHFTSPAKSLRAGCFGRDIAASVLRREIQIAKGTHVVVMDQGKEQFRLQGGSYTARDMKSEFTQRKISAGARALQLCEGPFEIRLSPVDLSDGYVARPVLELQFDENRPDLILREGRFTAAQIGGRFRAPVRRWLNSNVQKPDPSMEEVYRTNLEKHLTATPVTGAVRVKVADIQLTKAPRTTGETIHELQARTSMRWPL
jgi:hypothetical protein